MRPVDSLTSPASPTSMAERPAARTLFQLAHWSTFAMGLAGLLAGTVASNGVWFLVAGPCLSVSGLLILFGSVVTFRGSQGRALRSALGPANVMRLNFRATLWILIGLAVAALGYSSL